MKILIPLVEMTAIVLLWLSPDPGIPTLDAAIFLLVSALILRDFINWREPRGIYRGGK